MVIVACPVVAVSARHVVLPVLLRPVAGNAVSPDSFQPRFDDNQRTGSGVAFCRRGGLNRRPARVPGSWPARCPAFCGSRLGEGRLQLSRVLAALAASAMAAAVWAGAAVAQDIRF